MPALFLGEVELAGNVDEAAFGPGPFFWRGRLDGSGVGPDLSWDGAPAGAAGAVGEEAAEGECS